MSNNSSSVDNLACKRILFHLNAELRLNGIALCHKVGDSVVVKLISGQLPGLRETQSIPWKDSIGDWVYTGRCDYILPDLSETAYAPLELSLDIQPSAVVAIPVMQSRNKLYGYLFGIAAQKLTGDLIAHQRVLAFCTLQIEQVLTSRSASTQDASVIKSLTKQAYQDSMTGLLNRNGWELALASTASTGFGAAQMASAIVIDVDNLKWINDTRGHAAGDDVICQVADVLQRIFSEHGQSALPELLNKFSVKSMHGDSEESSSGPHSTSMVGMPFIARTGGDEFMGVLFGCSDANTLEIVTAMQVELSRLGLSVSIGHDCCQIVDKLPEAIQNADQAMYEQKKQSNKKGVSRIRLIKSTSRHAA